MPPLAKLLKRKRCQASRSQGGSRAASNVSKWNSANVDVAPLHADSSSEESEGASQGFNQGPGAYRELLHALKHQRRSVNVQDAWMDSVDDGSSSDEAELQCDQAGQSEKSGKDEKIVGLTGTKLGYKTQKSASGVPRTEEELVVGSRIEDDDDKMDDILATDVDDYEGPPNGVDDFFELRLNRELTDAEASELKQHSPRFEKEAHSDYQDVWPSGNLNCSRCTPPGVKSTLEEYGVCGRVREAWAKDKKDRASEGDFVSPQQNALYSLISCYQDVFIPERPYPTSYKDADPTLDACVAHCVNHVIRCLDVHKRHLSQIIKLRKSGEDVNEADFRDRGFTCPKVLFLAPMRSTAYRIIERILKYGANSRSPQAVQGLDRVIEEFAPDEKLEQVTMEKDKPDDYNGIFGGNVSDTFRIGIQFSRDGLTCFTNFYRSDIVVASPLSLSMMVAGEGLDFLSSIDILVIDRADVLTMQNWQHVITAVRQVNRMPKAQHNVNIMRVREYCLKDQARLYRQTIMLSSFATAEMNSLFSSACCNMRGQVRLNMNHRDFFMGKVVPAVKHIFERHGVDKVESNVESRLMFFKDKIVPKLTSMGTGILIFVPHYFDYIRLRKLLHQEEMDFSWITEYSNEKHARKCRSAFFEGECRIMLITERAYFYSRKRIGGIKDIIFYGLPLHAAYYPEIINMIEETTLGVQRTVTSLFSKYSWLQLERVVGTSRGKQGVVALKRIKQVKQPSSVK